MLRFDDFRLDPAVLRVFRKDVQLDAPPQVVEVLAYLIANGDRIVSRQELLERFWPRAGTGGDAALNTCIRRIRTLLQDDAETPLYIQTRPRSGYRFIGTLANNAAKPPFPHRNHSRLLLVGSMLAVLAVGGTVWTQGTRLPPRHRIAVEPIRGLCEYVLFPNFNVGLRESLVAQISHALPPGYSIAADGRRFACPHKCPTDATTYGRRIDASK